LIKGTIHQEEINDCKYLCTKCQHSKFHKTNTTRYKNTCRTQHNNNVWFQYPTLTNSKTSTKKLQNQMTL
jgi:hypothetical protein